MRNNSTTPYDYVKNGCLTVLTAFLTLIVICGIFVFVSIYRFIAKSREADINHYCSEVQIPQYASSVDKYETVEFHGDDRFRSLESRKFRDEQKLCDALPYGFSDAVSYALTQGKREEATDIAGITVTRYFIPEKMMPLDSTTYNDLERYYTVLEYPDGSYRFAVIVEATYPDRQ